MNPTHLPRPLRVALYATAVLILLYLCLAPNDELPKVSLWDKQEHAISWFVLSATGLMLSNHRPRAIAAFSFALGVVVEIAQASMHLGRHGDWHDLAADSLGIAVAFIGYFAYLLIPRRRPEALEPGDGL